MHSDSLIGQANREPNISSNRPILVTGAHRSSTTWVGKMLTASGQVAYISEPLNVRHRPGVMRKPIRYWYNYISTENERDYLPSLRDMLQFRYHTWEEIKSLRSLKDLLRMARDWSNFQSGRLYKKRPLLKDPFAVFSAPWFFKALDCQIVITVRHPAAFISSLKRLDWPFDFNDLLSQPLLMQDWLEPYRGDMERLVKESNGIIKSSCMLWRIIYSVVKEFQQQYPQFRIFRHEDLSIDPLQGFQEIYNNLDLEFTEKVKRTIINSSSADNPMELISNKKHTVKLDSRSNLLNWKHRLNSEEIFQIRKLTDDLTSYYYPDLRWD